MSIEVHSLSYWVPLVEVLGVLFCLSLVVVERDLEALFLKQAENGLWDLDPRPFNACIGGVYTSDLDDLVEFEEV